MIEQVARRLRVFEELIKARLEVDVSGLVAGVRARLEAQLALSVLPIAADLSERAGPLGLGAVHTQAWEAERFRKIVLSHMALPPLVEGFALVAHPRRDLLAPVLDCDLTALPMHVSVHCDVYGSSSLGDAGSALADEMLGPLQENFAQLGSGSGPLWARSVASALGLHARVSPRVVDDAFAGLGAAVGRYLDLVQTAPAGDGTRAQADFFSAFHRHGPRRGLVARVVGRDWTERYSRLLFE